MKKLPFTCPLCGKKTDRLVDELKEGASLICPFCNLELNLHGHMWEEVRAGIDKLVLEEEKRMEPKI
jgi:transcription elongation factor Elf1